MEMPMESTDARSFGAKNFIEQFAKFFIVGIMNTLVDLLVLNAETIITGIKSGTGYGVQKGLSFIVAVTFSYFLNKRWTFQDASRENAGKKFSQFIFVSLVGMAINVTAATLAIAYLKTPINTFLNMPFMTDQVWVTLGGLTGTAFGLVWNFIGYKFWVFKK